MDLELPISEPKVPRIGIKSARRKTPFDIEPGDFDFETSARIQEEKKQERLANLRLSLVDRAKLLTPLVPMHNFTPRSARAPPPAENKRVRHKKFKKSKKVTDKVNETRDAYLMELILFKKEKQQKKILKDIAAERENIEAIENVLSEQSHKCIYESNRIEMELQKARKLAGKAAQERADLQRQELKLESKITAMNYEIMKNEELLERYNRYDNFLKEVCPQDESFENFMEDPSNLINVVDLVEKENTFVIKKMDDIEDLQLKGSHSIQEELDLVNEALNEIERSFARQKIPDAFVYQDNNEEIKVIEDAVEDLSNDVERLFLDCFSKKAILTPLEMLGKIESTLEEMYIKADQLNTKYLHENQGVIDAKRKEEARRKIAQERERLLIEKKENALARATKPIKKRNGRRLMIRQVPKIVVERSEEELIKKQMEKRKLQELLYGDENAGYC